MDKEADDKQKLIIKSKMTLLLGDELAGAIGDAMLDERILNFNEFGRRVFWLYIDNLKSKNQAKKQDSGNESNNG